MRLYENFARLESVKLLPASQREELRIELDHLDKISARVAAQDAGGGSRSSNLRRLVVDGDLYVPAGVVKIGPDGTGNVVINTNGIKLNYGTTNKIWLQTDGDVFIGTNTAAAATTYLSIFSGAQTYNSESVEAGDMLIGDNSSSKANIFWDKSAGQLLFRGGTTPQVYIDTTGALSAGGGKIVLDGTGMQIIAPTAYAQASAVSFVSAAGGTVYSELFGFKSSSLNTLYLGARAVSGVTGTITMEAFGVTGKPAQISMGAGGNGGNTNAGVTVASSAAGVASITLTAATTTASGTFSASDVLSGTYTPTLTGTANVAASTAFACQYMRVGNVVTVSGQIDIDPTAAAPTATDLGISLPIASNLASQQQLAGVSDCYQIALQGGTIRGDAANDRATLSYVATSTANQSHFFTFTYLII